MTCVRPVRLALWPKYGPVEKKVENHCSRQMFKQPTDCVCMWESLLAKVHFLEQLLSLTGFPLFSLLHLFLHGKKVFIWSIVNIQITWQDESMTRDNLVNIQPKRRSVDLCQDGSHTCPGLLHHRWWSVPQGRFLSGHTAGALWPHPHSLEPAPHTHAGPMIFSLSYSVEKILM